MLIIIGISGYKGSGKSSAAKVLALQFSLRDFNSVYFIGFADAVKQELAKELKVDLDWIEERKNIPKVRRLIQERATEERRYKNENIWIEILENKIKKLYKPTDALYKMVVLISDVRFQNEVEWIKRHNGLVFRVERSYKSNGKEVKHTPEDTHESERHANILPVDYIIHNDQTLIKLGNEMRDIYHNVIKPHYKI